MVTEEMKVALAAAPDKCLITGLEKCESYMIAGNVVYLPRPAYDAYTLPEYIAKEREFHQIKYDMDNDFVETENGTLCTLDELIAGNHPNLEEIKKFYNIPELDFVCVFRVNEVDTVAAYSLDEALAWYKDYTGLSDDDLASYDEIETIEHSHLVYEGEEKENMVSVLSILEELWKGTPFIAVSTGGY